MNNQQPTSNLLKRDIYKAIKRMEREQLSNYVSNVYIKGYEAGRKASTPNALLNALRDTLLSVADIGPTRADAIIKRLSDTMKLDATAEQPNPAPASDAVKRLATELRNGLLQDLRSRSRMQCPRELSGRCRNRSRQMHRGRCLLCGRRWRQ